MLPVLLWAELSCKGRCFESFQRGRECDCDSQCKEFGKCCDDYESFCEEGKDHGASQCCAGQPARDTPASAAQDSQPGTCLGFSDVLILLTLKLLPNSLISQRQRKAPSTRSLAMTSSSLARGMWAKSTGFHLRRCVFHTISCPHP